MKFQVRNNKGLTESIQLVHLNAFCSSLHSQHEDILIENTVVSKPTDARNECDTKEKHVGSCDV